MESERWREYVETSDVLVGRIGLGLSGRAGSGRREYGLASANRGGASDEKEVAGLNLALADLYQQAAEAADGAAKQQYLAAAAGYLADANEMTPNVQGAMDVLAAAGLKSRLTRLPLKAGAEDRPQEPAPEKDPAPQKTRPQPERRPAPGAADADVDRFDLSGFPRQPTNFEEQQVMEAIRSATTSALKADAHERLARYYEKRDDAVRAHAERTKAVAPSPRS